MKFGFKLAKQAIVLKKRQSALRSKLPLSEKDIKTESKRRRLNIWRAANTAWGLLLGAHISGMFLGSVVRKPLWHLASPMENLDMVILDPTNRLCNDFISDMWYRNCLSAYVLCAALPIVAYAATRLAKPLKNLLWSRCLKG